MSYTETLDAWLSRDGNTVSELAKAVDTHQPNISRYRAGRFPDSDMARKIHDATGGEVSFDLWRTEFLEKSGLAA